MDHYIGRLLENRYEILEPIGNGGMALVFKARCHRLNRLVAIKILKDDLSQDAEFRRRFHAESQAVAMLSHPNIVNVYDVSHSDNIDYIVMELIDGITLKQYMQQKGVLNWREVLHFSTQIAKALEHAHSRGIIHRDIKPHNIMILKDGSVKVADFGIARVSSAQSTLTREALGSVHYISPEQAKGSKIDYRSDLYSLGVVIYEMLTGQPPYDGETPVSVAIKHINGNAPLPRSINPQIPIGLEYICMHAMTAELENRYESTTDMLCDLDEFRRNPSVNFETVKEEEEIFAAVSAVHSVPDRPVRNNPVSEKTTANRRTTPHRSNSAALVAGVICIALALLLIGYFLYSFFFADFFSNTIEVEVPNFVNEYAEEIDNRDYPNFLIQIKEWVPDETVPIGQVIRQEPYSGRMVKSGSTISLTVSSGPSTDTMRNLINSTVSNARTILDNLALNLDIRIVPESSDVYMKDAVIRTEPAKDEPLSAGQTVTLYVSTGPDVTLIQVPELVGMDMDSAVKALTALDLKYGISYITASEAEGTVIFQSIKQQELVKEGTTINLQISNGPKDESKDHNTDKPDEEEKYPVFSNPTVILLPMPNGSGTVELSVFMDDELFLQVPLELQTISDRGFPIAPENVEGIHEITVFIDDKVDEQVNTNKEPWYQMTYNFDTGEQVEE